MTPARTTLAASAVAAGVIAVDQLTKALVRGELTLGERRDLLVGIDLVNVRNTGIAFGFLENGGALLVIGAAIALIALVVFFVTHAGRRLVWLPTGLLLGGAIGNLIDRATAGYVLDFVDASWRGWHFWAFNVADAAITVGVSFMILDLLGLGTRVSRTI